MPGVCYQGRAPGLPDPGLSAAGAPLTYGDDTPEVVPLSLSSDMMLASRGSPSSSRENGAPDPILPLVRHLSPHSFHSIWSATQSPSLFSPPHLLPNLQEPPVAPSPPLWCDTQGNSPGPLPAGRRAGLWCQ